METESLPLHVFDNVKGWEVDVTLFSALAYLSERFRKILSCVRLFAISHVTVKALRYISNVYISIIQFR